MSKSPRETTGERTKHTAGPWTVNAMPGHFFELQSPEGPVLRIRSGMMPSYVDGKVLAAAPDLLDVLRQVIEASAVVPPGTLLSDAIDAARKVVAKVQP